MYSALTAPAAPVLDPVVREATDPHCLSEDRVAALLTGAPWRRLAVLGDSIAEGLGDPVPGYRDASWADRLADGLATTGQVSSLNLGRRGMIASEIRSGQLTQALEFEPDLAVLSAGGNDLLRPGFDLGSVRRDLEAMVSALAASGCLVVTFGLMDISRFAGSPEGVRHGLHRSIAALNATTRAVTRRHRGVHVDFFDHPALDESLMSADMIHPNRRGHACIAAGVVRALSLQPFRPWPAALVARADGGDNRTRTVIH